MVHTTTPWDEFRRRFSPKTWGNKNGGLSLRRRVAPEYFYTLRVVEEAKLLGNSCARGPRCKVLSFGVLFVYGYSQYVFCVCTGGTTGHARRLFLAAFGGVTRSDSLR